MKKKVFVGISGGVDSSVAAYLLKKQKFDTIGIFIKSWEDCNTQDFEDALLVCDKLKIPLYTFDFTKEYREKVFKNFLSEYEKGNTPNPDILCNKEIKFNLFLKKAKELKADFIATGHYAQNINNTLVKAKDPFKDQTYFLYTLKEEILKNVLFPIGHLTKKEVRKIAKKNKLPTADKKDSTGICFIGKRKFRPFLQKYISSKKGKMIDEKGKIIGEHEGIYFYTIGQREGLKIGGKGKAWFVVDKDVENNTLIVSQGEDHPLLFSKNLIATNLTFISDGNFVNKKCFAKIRYRHLEQECYVKIEKNKAYVQFMNLQRAITKGQSVVFYKKNTCLGGGIISGKF